MRPLPLTLAAAAVSVAVLAAEDGGFDVQLKLAFPSATSFSAKEGNPPHYKAFVQEGGKPRLAGYAYQTIDLEPLERGYEGPIRYLVGMDLKGVLQGVVLLGHNEPYGNFSIDLPGFPAQFKGKSIRDTFRVGVDVDHVSRATISITSSARAIKNSSRRMARAYLTPDAVK